MLPQLALKPVFCQEVSHGGEQLEPMVSGVGDENLVLRVCGHIPRVKELAVTGALLSEFQYEFP